jgi:hypothetical protein
MWQEKSILQTIRRWYFSKTFLWILVGIGIVLQLSQYLFNRSFWVDEALVATKLIDSSYADFWQPSESPIGFLIVEKFVSQVLGESEYALRLFPFLSGVLSIVLFRKLAARYLQPVAVPIALGLFTLSGQLIYHATTLKQYASDVCITIMLYLITMAMLSKRVTRLGALGFGILGAVALWFAHPVVFILGGVGGYILLSRMIKKDWAMLRTMSITYGCWLVSFIVLYALSFRAATGAETAQQFWAGHFMPLPPTSFAELLWFVRTFFETLEYVLEFSRPIVEILSGFGDILASVLGLSPSIGISLPDMIRFMFSSFAWSVLDLIAAVILLTGAWSMLKRDQEKFCLLASPIVLTLLASGLHKYPFANRLILFLIPILFLFLGEGARWFWKQSQRRSPLIELALIGALLLHPVYLAGYNLIHPRTQEEARPVLQYLKDHQQDKDIIYVYYGSSEVFRYYARQLDLKNAKAIQGIMSREDRSKYIQDLQQLRGHKRVWLFFSHAYSEKDFFLYYLDNIGKRLDEFKAEGAAAYLYDLS